MPNTKAQVKALAMEIVNGKVINNTPEDQQRRQEAVSPLVPTVLERARDLLSDRDKWTTGATAKGPEGNALPVDDPWAQKWCAIGAIEKCAKEVWAENPTMETWPDGWSLLVHLTGKEVLPHMMTAARALHPGVHQVYLGISTTIPSINDSPWRGGYAAVINGLKLATGQPITEALAAFAKRSAAAKKGWETRNRKEQERAKEAHEAFMRWAKERDAEKALATQTMSFGGTVSPQINADAKETADVSAR